MSILNKAKLGLVGTAVALGLTFTAGAASALPSVTGEFSPGINQFSDNSGEIVYDQNGNVASTIAKGDIFAGVVQISSFPLGPNNPASNYNQLTAIFAVVVDSVTATSASNCGGNPDCFAFTFSSDGKSLAQLLAAAAGNSSNPLFGFNVAGLDPALSVAGTVGAFYEGNGNSGAFIDHNSVLTDAQIATSGTLRLTAGDAAGGSWTGNGPQSLNDLVPTSLGGGSPLSQGAAQGGFSITETIMSQNFPGYQFDPIITGQGTIAFLAANPFKVTDNTSFFVNITPTPEPVTLSLFGAGLIGAAGLRRRKKA